MPIFQQITFTRLFMLSGTRQKTKPFKEAKVCPSLTHQVQQATNDLLIIAEGVPKIVTTLIVTPTQLILLGHAAISDILVP